jgi:hypothetical protein
LLVDLINEIASNKYATINRKIPNGMLNWVVTTSPNAITAKLQLIKVTFIFDSTVAAVAGRPTKRMMLVPKIKIVPTTLNQNAQGSFITNHRLSKAINNAECSDHSFLLITRPPLRILDYTIVE